MGLAAKLPYSHPYAGGFPRLGSQQLPSDPDALTYLAAVATADGAAVEVGVAMAVDSFIKGCKADGIWDAIKASCILCGARTLSGALVPLAGTAPTNNNFVAADYARGGATPGLKGNGSTKYLDSNRNNNADPQNNFHAAVYASVAGTGPGVAYLGAGATSTETGASNFGLSGLANKVFFRCRQSSPVQPNGVAVGLVGISRSASASYIHRHDGVSATHTIASQTPHNANLAVFALTTGVGPTDARLAFYSIGEAVDLEDLDDAVSALVTAIGAAI